MLHIDLSFPDPASNLAFDEALLESAESGQMGEILRTWESPAYFVVLGYSSKWKNEVRQEACGHDQVPILRRKSGGATVLQGPGCLNFSLVLESKNSSGIKSDTRDVMEKNLRAALTWKLEGEVKIQGVSDLTWSNKKFSGNAMRRGKNFFLFHGTFLYNFDLKKISQYLGTPDREPAYRSKRSHREFLTNIPTGVEKIKSSLIEVWKAREAYAPNHNLNQLKSDFYSNEEWNLKY